jgi:hypothetical protein
MFEFKFNMVDMECQAKTLNGAMDQAPFALSLALNDAVKNARQVLVQDTWPHHVSQRNSSFIGRALRTNFAVKNNLRVEIYDDLGRANLKLHASGGTERPRNGRFAIPPKGSVVRGARGVRKSQQPAAIIARTPKRALRVTSRGIFVGEVGKLKLKYSLLASAIQPADVPFQEVFEDAMRNGVRTSFPAAMTRAMSSRRG